MSHRREADARRPGIVSGVTPMPDVGAMQALAALGRRGAALAFPRGGAAAVGISRDGGDGALGGDRGSMDQTATPVMNRKQQMDGHPDGMRRDAPAHLGAGRDDGPPGRVTRWVGGLVAAVAVFSIGFDPAHELWRLGFPGMPLEFQSVSVSASDLGLVLLVAYGGWCQWRGPRRPLPVAARPAVAAGILLLGCLTLSLIPAPARWLSAWQIGEVGLGLLTFVTVARRPWFGRRLLVAGAALVLFQLPQVLVQEVVQSSVSLGSPLPGWPPVLPAAASGALVVFGPAGLRWQRGMGSFLHPNLLGGFLALALVLALPWLGRSERYRAGLWVVWTIGWIELLLTFSRAALLGAVLGCAVSAIAQRRRSLGRAGVALLALMPAVVVAGAVLLMGNVLLPRITPDSALLASVPVENRALLMGIAVRLIAAHPLLGVGAANFTVAELAPPIDGYIFQPVHLVPLLVAAEAGVLAGAAWLSVVLGGPIVEWHRRARDGVVWVERLAVPVVVLVLAALDHYLWTFAAGEALFWITLGIWAARPEQLEAAGPPLVAASDGRRSATAPAGPRRSRRAVPERAGRRARR